MDQTTKPQALQSAGDLHWQLLMVVHKDAAVWRAVDLVEQAIVQLTAVSSGPAAEVHARAERNS